MVAVIDNNYCFACCEETFGMWVKKLVLCITFEFWCIFHADTQKSEKDGNDAEKKNKSDDEELSVKRARLDKITTNLKSRVSPTSEKFESSIIFIFWHLVWNNSIFHFRKGKEEKITEQKGKTNKNILFFGSGLRRIRAPKSNDFI